MKLLLVEDDSLKQQDIQRFLSAHYPEATIDVAISYMGAVERCYNIMYDFLIIDMNIPLYEKNDHDRTIVDHGGEMIVRELVMEGILMKFVIVSQYETVGEESKTVVVERISSFCGELYCGFVSYASNQEGWKMELGEILNNNLYV